MQNSTCPKHVQYAACNAGRDGKKHLLTPRLALDLPEGADVSKADVQPNPYSERQQTMLAEMITKDAVMAEHAPTAVTCSYLARDDLFDSATTKDGFKEFLSEVQNKGRDTKTLAAALKKCVAEIVGMQKVARRRCFIRGFVSACPV